MKLHSPQFQRALKRGVKKAIKASPALKREYRAANRYRRHYSGALLGRALVWLIIGWLIALVTEKTQHVAAPLGLISLWLFIFVFVHANALFLRLFASTDLAIFGIMLPVHRDVIFRWELQKFLRRSIFSLVDVFVALGTIAALSEFPALKWVCVVPISILAWLLSIALAALCAARVNRAKYLWVSKFSFPSLAILYIALRAVPATVTLNLIERAGPVLNTFLPTGWAVSLFQLLQPDPNWLLALLLVPAIAIIASLPNSLARLRSFYVYREVERPEAFDVDPGPAVTAPAQSSVFPAPPVYAPIMEQPRRRGPTEIVDIIQSRVHFAPPRWPQTGWMEALLWRWFTPRERALSEFIFPGGVNILKVWKKTALIFAGAIAVGFGIASLSPDTGRLILYVGMFATFSVALSCAIQSGTVFRLALSSGVRVPFRAFFPVGVSETVKLLSKLTLMHAPMLLASSAVCGALIANVNGLPLARGITAGLRAGCLLLAARFIFTVFGISSGTNDTQQISFKRLLLVLSIVPFGILFLALGGCSIFLPEQGLAWGFAVLACASAFAFFRVYLWYYNRKVFDLMNLPQRSSF